MRLTYDGKTIRKIREDRGLSLADFADKLDNIVTRQAIHNWETYKAYPTVRHLSAIASAFSLPIDIFFLPDISHRALDCVTGKSEALK